MAMSPLVGRMYNRVPPAWIVGFGVVLFAIGSWQLSHITLATSSTEMILPLVVTGAAFACLFVPLTTAALSKIARHEMADAAGLNSFVRQVGGSVGLTIFATVFTNYSTEARAALASHVTLLRPEVGEMVARIKGVLMMQGMDPMSATAVAGRALYGRVAVQGTVLGFDRVFLMQGILFLCVIPLLFFLRVPRTNAPVHVELPAE
jgi:DHA2 family multidrug resistance protein